MVDMHCHIIWGRDDGPKTMAATMKLMEQAVNEGISTIIATSHSRHPLYDVSYDEVTKQVAVLQKVLCDRQMPLTVCTGHEVRLCENIVQLYEAKQIHPLANSGYLLIELPTMTVPAYTKQVIHQLLLTGVTPVIAHPERNRAIAENPDRLTELIRLGALAQLTAGSITGHFGRFVQKLSFDFIHANLVHLYGSDAHHVTARPFYFEKGLDYLEKRKQSEAVQLFLENNKKVIENEPIAVQEPGVVRNTKWWHIGSLL